MKEEESTLKYALLPSSVDDIDEERPDIPPSTLSKNSSVLRFLKSSGLMCFVKTHYIETKIIQEETELHAKK